MEFDGLRRWLERLVGPHCGLCGAPGAEDGLCDPCRADLPLLPAARCPRCALPTPDGAVCGVCLKSPPVHDGVVCPASYEFPVAALIRALKYHGRLAAARPLADLLGRAIRAESPPDLVLPMPIAPGHLAERGYNQVTEIARLLERRWRDRLDPLALERTTDAPPQASLPMNRRRRNVRGAFRCSETVKGRRVAVVDDVMTTGATLDEAARVLKRAGAVEVRGWIVARTPRGR